MAASLTNLAIKRTVKGRTIRCTTFACRVYVSIFPAQPPVARAFICGERLCGSKACPRYRRLSSISQIKLMPSRASLAPTEWTAPQKPCSYGPRNDKGHPKVAFVAGAKRSAEAYFFISQPVSSARALPMSASERTVFTPASCRAANFSSAVPLPPEMIAPAWPMRLPGGAVTPAM